jgi:DNA-binding transcriptional LysR family regulator
MTAMEAFLLVVDSGSFSAAARRLGRSAAVFPQIKLDLGRHRRIVRCP